MNNVCALDIQKTLINRDFVSLPWIQSKYGLSYKEARIFLEQLLIRGWVKKEPVGIQYEVEKRNLCLRKIEKSEVNKIIEDITSDAAYVLDAIRRKNSSGVSFSQLSYVVRGDDSAKDAISVLTKLVLIYSVDEKYFSVVSKATIDVIFELAKMKRSNELSRRLTGKKEDNEKMIRLFDSLWE